MNDTSDGWERRLVGTLAVLFGAVALLAAADLAGDAGSAVSVAHLAIEGSIVAIGVVGSLWMAGRFRVLVTEHRALAAHADRLARRLSDSEHEAEHWRREAGDLIAGLGDAIDRQLERWGLSPAEKAVALLLLKGLSHKEIGGIRGVSEATVRQQARALYAKADLEGRHDLAAFFLEDLLVPRTRVATASGAAAPAASPAAEPRS